MKGRLRYWNAAKGFGFIERSDRREENLFIHAVAFGENVMPEVGDIIECDVQTNDRDGRERAANARIVPR